MVTAITQFKAKDFASVEELEKVIKHLQKETPLEPGLLKYEVFRATENSLKYYIIEAWQREENLEAHAKLVLDSGIVEQVLPLVDGVVNTEIIENF